MYIDESNPKKNQPGGLSPRDTATALGTCISTVYVLLDKGELDSYRVGRARRIRPESIEALKDRNAVPPRGLVHFPDDGEAT